MSLSIFDAARATPRRSALVVDGVARSYAQVAADARSAAAWLRSRGADPAKRLALGADARYPTVVTIYAALALGVPLAPIDPRWTAAERRRWCRLCAPVIRLERPWEPSTTAAQPADPLPAAIDPGHCLAVLPTSGSSGRPKGVVLSRRAFRAAAAASAANLGWRRGDRWLLALPLAHVGGLSVLVRCLLARRTVVLESLPRFDAAAVAATVAWRRVTLLSLVPTMLQRLLDLTPPWRPPARLRAILLGGAAASPALLAAAGERGYPVLTTYGLTEACSQVTAQAAGSRHRGEGGCGRPLPGMAVRIAEGGGIEVAGPSLMDGYLGTEAERGEAFTADGWLATGDLGRLDPEGRLHVLGRRDQVILSGGENIFPGEVEAALEAHPGIAEACVFGVEDAAWGQAVAAALVAAAAPLGDAALGDHLGARLASFKRPRKLCWVASLPRTAAGKRDRAAAAARFAGRLRPVAR